MEQSLQHLREKLKFNVLLLVGPPLSGKGTQAQRLSSLLGIPSVSTGDLFRKEVATGSELGKRMKEFMDRGDLIPDEFTKEFLTMKFSENNLLHGGLILDGYPRNPVHLPIMESILRELDCKMLAAVHFKIEKETLMERLSGRLTCASCGFVTNTKLIKDHPADGNYNCSSCGAQLTKRKDDTTEIMEKRLRVYFNETAPLVPLLEEKKILFSIDCEDSPEVMTEKILHALGTMEARSFAQLDSYRWLEESLKSPLVVSDLDEAAKVFTEFRDKALEENKFHRTGLLRRFIYLQTTNLQKYREHLAIFEKFYGIEVLRIPPNLSPELIEILLLQKKQGLVPLAVIREESNLYRPNSDVFSSLDHGVAATNKAALTAYTLDKKTQKLEKNTYTYCINGRIDLTRRQQSTSEEAPAQGEQGIQGPVTNSDPKVFGWDDIFVLPSGFSYHQLKEHSIKRSSRDMVISEFIKNNIYYKDLLDVQFNPQRPERPIDFSVSVAKFVEANPYYNNPYAIKYGFKNLQMHVLNFGVFFRAARNRRQNNYWNPGLNGGIPLTKKRDEIHELTFMAHDFGHFAIPDLIYVGNNSIHHRRAYIAWRMISEATTMALADMLFVDSLKQHGVDYDFDTRRIYPLFRDLKIEFNSSDKEKFVENLEKIIKANYVYCLRGDASLYQQLLTAAGSSEENLHRFQEKFMPFFVEDFRWTEHNYDNMVKRSDELQRWWTSILPLRQIPELGLKSVDDFLDDVNTESKNENDFVDRVFDIVFRDRVKPVLIQEAVLDAPEKQLQRGFTRWMAGQLAICTKFHFIPESAVYQERITTLLLEHRSGMDVATVNHIRSVYEEYLHLLVEKSLISKDDESTFSELYPLFDPFYINYDKGVENYEELDSISRRIFSLETHRRKQFNAIERVLSRSLTESEKEFLNSFSTLVEESGGRIQDGFFVMKPGVKIISRSQGSTKPTLEDTVTFLLSGITQETTNELVLEQGSLVHYHSQPEVPLFCIKTTRDSNGQKKYLEDLLAQRSEFERKWHPKQTWQHGPEVWRNSLPGNKCSVVALSASLKSFHNLFQARLSSASQTSMEGREVIGGMAGELHCLLPSLILSTTEYTSSEASPGSETGVVCDVGLKQLPDSFEDLLSKCRNLETSSH